MSTMSKNMDTLDEIVLSIAISRDITDRHFYADFDITKSACLCGNCTRTILKDTSAIFVQNFERKSKVRIVLCDKDCSDAHEVKERKIFGCEKSEQLPPIGSKTKKISKSDLIYGYHCRLGETIQNVLDKKAGLRGSYQLEPLV